MFESSDKGFSYPSEFELATDSELQNATKSEFEYAIKSGLQIAIKSELGLAIKLEHEIASNRPKKFLKINKNEFKQSLNHSVENSVENIALQIMQENWLWPSDKEDLEKIASRLSKFFTESELGKFEFNQIAGKNMFRIDHKLETNGTILFKVILCNIINSIKRSSIHINETPTSISVIFR